MVQITVRYVFSITFLLNDEYNFFSRESLIRTAFQCLQLVVTDFLPTMPCTCLQIVVDVAGSFGLHNQELNISLTSIGLLVSIITFLIII